MTLDQKLNEIENMKRVWEIISHPSYQENLEKNQVEEANRIFCRHNLQHFIDVARLAYIFKLERGYDISKEMIYAAAFLHDIGKWQQYQEGTPHEKSSSLLAAPILKDSGFSTEEVEQVLDAILHHRKGDGHSPLAEVIYDADKISRNCYACPAEAQCNWKEEKKNLKVTW